MAGKLYGVGVGPGDCGTSYLKSTSSVKEAEVIALPGQVPEDTVAFKIVEGAYPSLEEGASCSSFSNVQGS